MSSEHEVIAEKSKIPRVLIIRNAFSFDFGGGERFPVNLAFGIQKYGYYPVVVSSSEALLEYAHSRNINYVKGLWWSRQNWSGKNAVAFPAYLVWQTFLTVWYLINIVQQKSDIVHPQSKDDFIAASLAAKILRKKVIWTDHADLKYIYKNLKVWHKNPVGKLVYLASFLADTITLVSLSEKKLIEESIGKPLSSRYRVIYNGVEDVKADHASRSSSKEIVFCATSRLVDAKGIGELISAFMTMQEEHQNTTLWLVGDGPDKDKFITQASNNKNIHFIGHSDTPLDYVAACDVFVHPSHHEGFSLSLIEAAMLTKPVIACSVGGNPELIDDKVSGLLVPAKDPRKLAESMIYLIDKPSERISFGKAARQKYEMKFNFDCIIRTGYIDEYAK